MHFRFLGARIQFVVSSGSPLLCLCGHEQFFEGEIIIIIIIFLWWFWTWFDDWWRTGVHSLFTCVIVVVYIVSFRLLPVFGQCKAWSDNIWLRKVLVIDSDISLETEDENEVNHQTLIPIAVTTAASDNSNDENDTRNLDHFTQGNNRLIFITGIKNPLILSSLHFTMQLFFSMLNA